MPKEIHLQPIILSGGSGTRLWPISRESFPKQYIAVNSSSKLSLLQRTQERLKGIKNCELPIIICNEEQRFIVAEQIREIDIKPKSIILEPYRRNTAPAITVAALKALENGNDPVLLVLSADHEIKNTLEFYKVIKEGIKDAIKNKLVTFGVIPTSPEIGYGYIESQKPLSKDNLESSKIVRFIEKPSKEKAKQLIKDKRYTWNSGIFLFKASCIINEISKFEPQLLELCRKSIQKSSKDFDFYRLDSKYFEQCKNISVDFAIMEKTDRGTVVPFDAGWSDMGSWQSLLESEKRDDKGNVFLGNVVTDRVTNSYIKSEKRLLACLGIDNLVVVETSDAVLVADAKQTQDIKNIVNILNKKGISEAKTHRKVYRPWGWYYSIEEGSKWQIKKIFVKPGASLSLQLHHHRSEHWIVVKGTAKVEIDNKEMLIAENQSTYIPLKTKHRLANPTDEALILIEVQSGEYLGEDDIIRFEDNYGRA